MQCKDARLKLVLNSLGSCSGVEALKILTSDERERILELEAEAENSIANNICRTINQGARDALQRDYTVALVIDTSIYELPHHPRMTMIYEDTVVGEGIDDENRIIHLKKDRGNFFLWHNFVIYLKNLPKGREERERLRMIHSPRRATELKGISFVEKEVFGTPSHTVDVLIKELLSFVSKNPFIGTCLIGFNLKN
jgi:hypothetical protein